MSKYSLIFEKISNFQKKFIRFFLFDSLAFGLTIILLLFLFLGFLAAIFIEYIQDHYLLATILGGIFTAFTANSFMAAFFDQEIYRKKVEKTAAKYEQEIERLKQEIQNYRSGSKSRQQLLTELAEFIEQSNYKISVDEYIYINQNDQYRAKRLILASLDIINIEDLKEDNDPLWAVAKWSVRRGLLKSEEEIKEDLECQKVVHFAYIYLRIWLMISIRYDEDMLNELKMINSKIHLEDDIDKYFHVFKKCIKAFDTEGLKKHFKKHTNDEVLIEKSIKILQNKVQYIIENLNLVQ